MVARKVERTEAEKAKIENVYNEMAQRLRTKISRKHFEDALQQSILEYLERLEKTDDEVLIKYCIAEGVRKTLEFHYHQGRGLKWTFEERIDPELREIRLSELEMEDEDGNIVEPEFSDGDIEEAIEAQWLLRRMIEDEKMRPILEKRLKGEPLDTAERLRLMRWKREMLRG